MWEHVWHEALNPLAFLERSAMVYPDKAAVVYKDTRYTYGELYARVNRLAGALKHAGVRQGDRVAFLVPNLPAMLEGHYGPLRASHPRRDPRGQLLRSSCGCGAESG